MPTYRNDNTSYQLILQNTAGNFVPVNPGESIATYHKYDLANLTETDAEPYWNPVLAITDVAFDEAADNQTIVLNASTKTVEIRKISDGVAMNVHFEAVANVPPVLKSLDTYDPIPTLAVEGKVGQIVLVPSAAGTCQVVELK